MNDMLYNTDTENIPQDWLWYADIYQKGCPTNPIITPYFDQRLFKFNKKIDTAPQTKSITSVKIKNQSIIYITFCFEPFI